MAAAGHVDRGECIMNWSGFEGAFRELLNIWDIEYHPSRRSLW
jgi:hypothetical protein